MSEKLKSVWARIEARLIDDWRQSYKFASAQCASVLIGLNWAHENIDVVQGMLPPSWMTTVNIILGIGVIYFRVTKQKSLAKDEVEK